MIGKGEGESFPLLLFLQIIFRNFNIEKFICNILILNFLEYFSNILILNFFEKNLILKYP